MTIGLVLHLVAAPTQIFVVEHVYDGIADWTRYTHQGAILAPNFRHFNFTLAGANVRQIVNDGSVSIATGIVMAIVGVNVTGHVPGVQLVVVDRDASSSTGPSRLTFAGADHRRYALDAVLPAVADLLDRGRQQGIDHDAFARARRLRRRQDLRPAPGGFVLLVPGVVIGYYIRPNELLLILAGFAVAMMLPTAAVRQNLGGLRRFFGLVVLAGLLVRLGLPDAALPARRWRDPLAQPDPPEQPGGGHRIRQ